MASGSGPYWSVVLPIEKTNLLSNPSGERGTTTWGTWIGGTVGTTSQFQQFGAWSGSVAPSSNGTAGILLGSLTLGAGTTYGVSCYVRGAVGTPYNLLISDHSGDNHQGSQTFTGGGTWHRISFTYLEQFGGPRKMTVRKQNSTSTDAFYVDGAQLEVGSVTTPIDGDQEGCYWLGAPHNSQSVRSGTYRGGGSVVSLASLGLIVNEAVGIGMPPLQNNRVSFAILDGAEFQRQRATERPFTLDTDFGGTTWTDYHVTRRRILNAFKIDAVSPQQPCRFYYAGAEGTVYIDAVLDGGMDIGEHRGFTEANAPIRFVADQPFWYSPVEQGTSLAPRTALGSVNYLARRSALGAWGSLGAGTSVNGTVQALEFFNGTVFLGGEFTSVAGTTSGPLAMYFPQTNTFGTMGGTVDSAGGVTSIQALPNGTIVFGGTFSHISGLTNTRNNAQWTSAGFGTMQGGTATGYIFDMVTSRGTVFLGGLFSQTGGIANTRFLSKWTRSGYSALAGGTTNDTVVSLTVGLNRTLYVGGIFGSADGTAVNFVAQWANAWGSMGSGFTNAPSQVDTLTTGPSGVVYAGGGWGSAGGGSALNTGQWNGVQWFAMSGGLGAQLISISQVFAMYADPKTGNVYAAGAFTNAGARTIPQNHAEFNGNVWLPFDIAMASNADTRGFLKAPDGALYIAGLFAGTAYGASVGTIVNRGMSEAYPKLFIKNTSATGTASIYQLSNNTTGDKVFFNLQVEPGEELLLDLTPGRRSFTSNLDGNVFGAILPGSNLAALRLLPGTNYIAFFSDSDTMQVDLYYRPRHESADGGTVL